MDIDSLCIHGGKVGTDSSGAISTPIYQTATYAHPGLGKSTGFDYSRGMNPTRGVLQETMAKLEGGVAAYAFSSGLAAASAMMELFQPGDHIISSDDLYGGTWRLFQNFSMKNGLIFDWVDASDPTKVEAAIRPETKAVFIETPTNPLMHVNNIAAIAEITKRHGLLLLVDNTFLSPVNQQPIKLGANIVLHSATKYLSGHNDTLAGILVCDSEELSERLHYIQNAVGASLGAFDSWLVLRGIQTLPIRIKRQQDTALKIARWLEANPKIAKVFYPGLKTHPSYQTTLKQSRGFGGMISFEISEEAGGENLVRQILEGVKLIQFAESLGGTETLITYPTTQTHGAIPEAERIARGITNKLLRLSIGLEHPDDLIADLAQAMGDEPPAKDDFGFNTLINRKGTGSLKYDYAVQRGKPEDILPLWVADMDFKVPPSVTTALQEAVSHGIYGYTEPKPGYFEAVQGWFKRRHNWSPKAEWLVKTPGVVYAICTAIRALTQEGDAILIQQPVYYPFSLSIRDNHRKLINNPLVLNSGHYEIDLADFEKQIVENNVKLFILCNPHNPVGRIWTRDELKAMADICLKHHVLVISDEIHADFAFPGYAYTPYGQLGDIYQDNVVICTAPSKTFNIAGLQVSNIFIPNADLRKQFQQAFNATGYDQMNTMGLIAAQAAYEGGETWLDALLAYLTVNLGILRKFTAERLPGVKLIEPEGTYLIWLDFADTGLSGKDLDNFIVNDAHLWLDHGEIFGPGGETFERINIACPATTLIKALEQLEKALKEKTGR